MLLHFSDGSKESSQRRSDIGERVGERRDTGGFAFYGELPVGCELTAKRETSRKAHDYDNLSFCRAIDFEAEIN